MNDRAFIDTDVIVYLFERQAPNTQRGAARLLTRLAQQPDAPVISTQVLQAPFPPSHAKQAWTRSNLWMPCD